ncbi:MAG: glucose-6-phosphate isomerase, partial [Abiotrophia defectiva]
MAHIKFDYSTAKKFFGEHELTQLQDYVTVADRQLREGTGAGSDYTGWVTWPEAYDKEEFAQVQAAAEKIRQDSDVLVVIGIGGSYLGARAAIEFLNDSFYN